ncbi:MAG TPA: hypothetical protein VNS34_04775 [Rhizobiaceae bacterium]|nr:hypothetical protein [Rhizobiaceae bacterium]
MGRSIAQHSLFKPKASKAETKADVTSDVARAIVRDEAERREAKTARLRQERLDSEKKMAATTPARPDPKKGAPTRRARSKA